MGFLGTLFQKVNPFVGSSLVTGGLGLISGILGADSSAKGAKYSADASLQATRETNEQNYQLWKEQRQFAIDSWNAENQYNTPAAQRARLESAGYNPYLAFGDVGNTGGAISQPAATPFQAPSDAAFPNTRGIFAEGLNQSFQNALNVLQSAVQMQNIQANTNKTNQDTEQAGKMFEPLFQSAKYRAKGDMYIPRLSYEQWRQMQRDNEIGELTKDFQVKIVGETLNQIKAQTTLMKLNAKTQETLNNYLDQNQQLDIAIKAQTLVNLFKDGEIKAQDLKIKLAQEILTYAQANGQKLENQYASSTLQDRIDQQGNVTKQSASDADKSQADARKSLWEAGSAKVEYKKAEATAQAIIETTLLENGYMPDGSKIAGYETAKAGGTLLNAVGVKIPGIN